MGCWNGTCGFTNLPIMSGEKMVLFPIRRVEHARTGSGGYVYPYDQFAPISIPVHGDYNDYGGIENITKNGELVFEHLTKAKEYRGPLLKPQEKEMERHKYFGGEDHPKDIEELINDFIERGLYEDIGFMMIRKEIYDTIIQGMDKTRQKYRQAAHDFLEAHVTRQEELKQEIEEFKAILEVETDEEKKRKWKTRISRHELSLEHPSSDFRFEMETKVHNDFARYFEGSNPSSYILKDIMMNALAEKDKETFHELIDLMMIELSMYQLRRGWGLQPGAGSQDDRVELHMALAFQTIESAMRIPHRYEIQELDDNQMKEMDKEFSRIQNHLFIAKSMGNGLGDFIEELWQDEEE